MWRSSIEFLLSRAISRIPVLLMALLIVGSPTFCAQDQTPAKQWAVLIAVREYADPENNLRFTLEDAKLVRQILIERAGVPSNQILVFGDEAPAKFKPTLENLRREIPKFLAPDQVGKSDRVLIFYSGHGLREGGETYLVPSDFGRDSKVSQALPIHELRAALDQCSAAIKFLILDTCHAGSDKSPVYGEPAPEDLVKDFVRTKPTRCVVLASCKASERSKEWPERHNGVFTYWFCRALEGGADKDGDGQLTADEVYDYTYERVVHTVSEVFRQKQTPMRELSGVEGVPVLLTLNRELPETLCCRLAWLLNLEIRDRKLSKVGVFEPTRPGRNGDRLAPENLPAYCSGKIRETLTELAGGTFGVANEEESSKKKLSPEDVGNPRAMNQIGWDGLIFGTLRRRGDKMQLQLDLLDKGGNNLISFAGLFPLSEGILGDLGNSADTRQRPPGDPYDPSVVRVTEEQGQLGHPLLNPSFPFRLEVWSVEASPRGESDEKTPRKKKEPVILASPLARAPGEREPQQLAVPARAGEWFEIRVENRSEQRVSMTLLVDGLNTLGQRRERLGEGWSWVLDPKKTYAIGGWWIPTKENAVPGQIADFQVRPFRFVGVPPGVDARKEFGDSIGLITAAFYSEKTGRGPLEVDRMTPAQKRQLETTGFVLGEQRGVVHIRYVDEQDLQR